MTNRRSATVFCVSDHTGLTAEAVAHTVLSRFDDIDPKYEVRPFVDSIAALGAVLTEIERVRDTGVSTLVFTTLVDPELRAAIQSSGTRVVALFEELLDDVADELNTSPATGVGQRHHAMGDMDSYQTRIDAVDFTLALDDGLGLSRYGEADLIVIGPSRVAKTPTCLFLSLQYGLRAANYPLTSDDLDHPGMPPALDQHRDKLFGLTMDPTRLQSVRQRRRPGTPYATLERCIDETSRSEQLYRRYGIPFIDSTNLSIEELAANIVRSGGLRRRY